MDTSALNLEPGTVHLLPKKPGQKGRVEVHCLEDACIMVRVPSGSISHKSSASLSLSDISLKEYAEHIEASREKSAISETIEQPFNEYDNYAFFDDEECDPGDEAVGQSEENLAFTDFSDCTQFLDPISFAKELVNMVVAESEDQVEVNSPRSVEETTKPTDVQEEEDRETGIMDGFRESIEFFVEKKKSEVAWPTIGSFTVELGAYSIDEYLSSFDTEEDWMYVIYYQGLHEFQSSHMHRYQAIYSLPTWKYPIAQATASVFFTIEVCKTKPSHCLVDVTYRYETFRQVHKPGYFDFKEIWLHYILDAKIKFFQTVTY